MLDKRGVDREESSVTNVWVFSEESVQKPHRPHSGSINTSGRYLDTFYLTKETIKGSPLMKSSLMGLRRSSI